MAQDLAGVGALPFDVDGQPLRRKALAGLILAVALPIPLVSASGLSLPLPGFVERAAVTLADGVTSKGRQHSVAPSQRVTIARTVAERALATRAAVTPAPTSTPTRAAVHPSVARKSSAAVSPVRRSKHVAASTRRVALPAVAPAAVIDSATPANEVTTPSVSRAVDPAPAATPTVSVRTDTRVGDVAVDPVSVVPVVTVDPVAVVPVVTVDPGNSGSGNAGGNSGSGGTSGHGNSGSSNGGDNSGTGNGSGKAGTTAGSG